MTSSSETTPEPVPLRALMVLKQALSDFYGAPPTDAMLIEWWCAMQEAERATTR